MCCWSRFLIRVRAAWYFCGFTIRPAGRKGTVRDTHQMNFWNLTSRTNVFDAVIAASDDPVLHKQGEGVELLDGADVTPGTFEFFGMPALHGRVLQPADYQPGAPPVFVMRQKTWMERFNGDLGVLNKTFVLNGTARTLIGIMPPRFGWYGADVWIPKTPVPGAASGGAGSTRRWFLLGRLKPGVSKPQAAADATVIANQLAKI